MHENLQNSRPLQDEVRLDVAAIFHVYGHPPRDVVTVPEGAVQLSPLVPGSAALEDLPPGSLSSITILAPPATIERRAVLALALKALAAGGRLTALAPKDKGGSRLAKELQSFGLSVTQSSKAHHRIAIAHRPVEVVGIDDAIAAGGLRRVAGLGLWSCPGLFSWDRVDPGSALLIEHIGDLAGCGVDLGCGYGYLASHILASPRVERLTLVDVDRRAIAAAQRNISDRRVAFLWADARSGALGLGGLDFVVMNPPFHDGGAEDKALGRLFIEHAADMLREGGALWLTANRHLPYEAVLERAFRTVVRHSEGGGYKIYEAVK